MTKATSSTFSNFNYKKIDKIYEKIGLINKNNYIKLIDEILLDYQFIKEDEKYSKISVRKQHGIYYTNFKLAYQITEEAMNKNDKSITNCKFLEPCVGLGVFVISYLEYIYDVYSLNKIEIEEVLSNIYISDIDSIAVSLAKELISKYIKVKFDVEYKINNNNIYIGNVIYSDNSIHTVKSLFNKNFKFDIVLTNPPYKNLKASTKELNHLEYKEYQKYCKTLSELIKKGLKLQQGTINLYKVFIELIYAKFTTEEAIIGIIIPSSLLSDYTSSLLRKYILDTSKINHIYLLNESSKEFNSITQAMCFFGLKKNDISDNVKIIDMETKSNFYINLKEIQSIDSRSSLVKLTNNANSILNIIHKFPKLKDIDDIYNLRGELDLTLNKKYITEKITRYHLLQGKHIQEWKIKNDTKYVDESFLDANLTLKKSFINSERIICQQISNMSSNKRLKFSKIEKDNVLGNSCNFIAVKNDVNLDYLLAILNSYLMDWRFKLFSSNNHINNYELNDLPINLHNEYIDEIIKYSKEIQNGNLYKIVNLNKLIFKIYDINNIYALEILNSYNDEYANILKDSLDL
ncbi:Eco57I restriction-modification methylase domain-containing protein [Aliarcobacter butzleri]|uniref:Eco57I restriction-modification methylase domain-containing protein n=1 Tax=Aliarcobacter butzleri TaxID=28197 RepID=UPI00263E211B|nr:TaqI-like C-terminal specificity domain-containing protein [Aliarcobacter butzleri]MDN5047933.1 Eco57I restriction-modification methylase domain-containing protein [Aliarcobacter butzleri]